MSLSCREIPPHIGKHNILGDAFAVGVHKPEPELGKRIPLIGG